MFLHPTPSMEPPFFMQASMETRRSHHKEKHGLFLFKVLAICSKQEKEVKSSKGYQWINVMVSLFGSVISNHACSPKMQNNRIKLNI